MDINAYGKGHEVVDGRLVPKASPTPVHGRLRLRIASALRAFDGPAGRGRPGGWFIGTEIDVEFEPHQVYCPDMVGWHLERAPLLHIRPARVSPDWVCEVLSPSTAERDLGPKLRGYFRAGIGHYWLVNPENREFRELRWRDMGYEEIMEARPGDIVCAEPFDAVELYMDDILG